MRKAAHFTEFTALGACLAVDFRPRLALPWIIGVADAVTDEIHQIFVPGRACAITDVCIDAAGVALGVVIVYHYAKRRSAK